eukprot:TRINITY_DN4915_c0_g1_i3.p1 TRINITY_DN4915_c0_g1~~TRINITY_DN4915_c0_g1_i3.p1  ORF type:complete len:232 (+),score=-29.27 TRINITY_DN4915_c0_g1_i3:740-1435(+)
MPPYIQLLSENKLIFIFIKIFVIFSLELNVFILNICLFIKNPMKPFMQGYQFVVFVFIIIFNFYQLHNFVVACAYFHRHAFKKYYRLGSSYSNNFVYLTVGLVIAIILFVQLFIIYCISCSFMKLISHENLTQKLQYNFYQQHNFIVVCTYFIGMYLRSIIEQVLVIAIILFIQLLVLVIAIILFIQLFILYCISYGFMKLISNENLTQELQSAFVSCKLEIFMCLTKGLS